MPSSRVRRHIDWLLDAAGAGVRAGNWHLVRDRAEAALAFEPDNVDARAFLEAAVRQLAGPPKSTEDAAALLSSTATPAARAPAGPETPL